LKPWPLGKPVTWLFFLGPPLPEKGLNRRSPSRGRGRPLRHRRQANRKADRDMSPREIQPCLDLPAVRQCREISEWGEGGRSLSELPSASAVPGSKRPSLFGLVNYRRPMAWRRPPSQVAIPPRASVPRVIEDCPNRVLRRQRGGPRSPPSSDLLLPLSRENIRDGFEALPFSRVPPHGANTSDVYRFARRHHAVGPANANVPELHTLAARTATNLAPAPFARPRPPPPGPVEGSGTGPPPHASARPRSSHKSRSFPVPSVFRSIVLVVRGRPRVCRPRLRTWSSR